MTSNSMISLNIKEIDNYSSLKEITDEICRKYKIPSKFSSKCKNIFFDYVDTDGEDFYNMPLYDEDRITKPNDFRGFWACNACEIISYNPLVFRVDGIKFRPFLK